MLGIVLHTCNPSTWEAKARGLQVQAQCGQLSDLMRPCIKIKNKGHNECVAITQLEWINPCGFDNHEMRYSTLPSPFLSTSPVTTFWSLVPLISFRTSYQLNPPALLICVWREVSSYVWSIYGLLLEHKPLVGCCLEVCREVGVCFLLRCKLFIFLLH